MKPRAKAGTPLSSAEYGALSVEVFDTLQLFDTPGNRMTIEGRRALERLEDVYDMLRAEYKALTLPPDVLRREAEQHRIGGSPSVHPVNAWERILHTKDDDLV